MGLAGPRSAADGKPPVRVFGKPLCRSQDFSLPVGFRSPRLEGVAGKQIGEAGLLDPSPVIADRHALAPDGDQMPLIVGLVRKAPVQAFRAIIPFEVSGVSVERLRPPSLLLNVGGLWRGLASREVFLFRFLSEADFLQLRLFSQHSLPFCRFALRQSNKFLQYRLRFRPPLSKCHLRPPPPVLVLRNLSPYRYCEGVFFYISLYFFLYLYTLSL